MSYYEPITYIVPEGDDGLELKAILRRRMALSRKLLSRIKLTEEGITVNGERRYTSVRVKTGDVVEVRMEEEDSEDILPQDLPVDVIFEDEHLLIVNKPAGTIVHPTTGHWSNTLANGVVHMWQQRGLRIRFRPVHRLDRETSGVLAIAKNPYVHQHISEQMKAGKVEKEYTALVRGHMEHPEGTVDAPIDRNPDSPHYRIVTPSGYPSVTHYRVVEQLEDAAVLAIRLETGRTHQIRVHMAHLGHPLIGDAMYGIPEDRESYPGGRHALHASRLGFIHPVFRTPLVFEAPLPADLEALLSRLR
ncbi:RluA family pseudouridine synthase [Paenibacillus mesotrionivorans]|uniref:RluA family pseudouridine synthase n=1 Tax=Paenibacillus mesotrionivorans TaxID=3160968 RepID=A0ACC7NW78_9BACL